MNKNTLVWLITLLVGVILVGYSFFRDNNGELVNNSPSPSPTESASPSVSPSRAPLSSKAPLPTSDGRTLFIGEPVPWHLLPPDASCELKGEIKFLNSNIYDNQDAVFIYNGIDHPGRNITWTKTPDDGSLAVGPNIFSKLQIPYGQALLGVFPLEEPKSKKYELTAKIAYGRLVDENGKIVTAGGNVKIFEKQCGGKTTVVFP